MCGGNRRRAPAPYGYGFSQPNDYQYGMCGGNRRRGPAPYGFSQPSQPYGQGPLTPIIAGVTYLVKAANERSQQSRNNRVQTKALPIDDQITGTTRGISEMPSPYPAEKPTYSNVKPEAGLEANDAPPPEYTPYANPRQIMPDMVYTSPRATTNTHANANANANANAPITSQITSLNSTFASLPILQSSSNQTLIQKDISNLENAMAAVRMGECGGRCAAKRAGRQLVRDLWDVESERRGAMGRKAWKQEMKGEMKEVKRLVREEVRRGRW